MHCFSPALRGLLLAAATHTMLLHQLYAVADPYLEIENHTVFITIFYGHRLFKFNLHSRGLATGSDKITNTLIFINHRMAVTFEQNTQMSHLIAYWDL